MIAMVITTYNYCHGISINRETIPFLVWQCWPAIRLGWWKHSLNFKVSGQTNCNVNCVFMPGFSHLAARHIRQKVSCQKRFALRWRTALGGPHHVEPQYQLYICLGSPEIFAAKVGSLHVIAMICNLLARFATPPTHLASVVTKPHDWFAGFLSKSYTKLNLWLEGQDKVPTFQWYQ